MTDLALNRPGLNRKQNPENDDLRTLLANMSKKSERQFELFEKEREGYDFILPHPSVKSLNGRKSTPDDLCRLGPDVDAAVNTWLWLVSQGGDVELWNEKAEQFVLHTCSLLKKASWEQLEQILRGVCCSRKDYLPLLRKLKTALDHECTSRLMAMVRDEGGRQMSEGQRRDVFGMASLWYYTKRLDDRQAYGWNCRYTRQLLKTFWTEENLLLDLTPQQFVFLCFLTGVHREFPNDDCDHREKSEHGFKKPPLPPYVVDKFRSVLPMLCLGEVGYVCHGLHMGGATLHTRSQDLNTDLLRLVRDANANESIREQFSVSCVFKLLHGRGSQDFELMQEVVDKYVPLVEHLTPMSKLRLVKTMVTSSIRYHDKIVDELVRTIVKDLHRLRLKDLDYFAFMLHWFNYSSCEIPIHEAIAAALNRADLRDNPQKGRNLVFLAGFLTKARVLQPQLVSELFERANSFAKFRSAGSRQELLEASVEWTARLTQHKMSARDLSQFVKQQSWRNRTIYQNTLFHLAEMDFNVELDFPDYDGARLDGELRSAFLPLGFYEESGSATEMLSNKVASELRVLFGHSGVHRSLLMPHAAHRDIVLCVDGDLTRSFPVREEVLHEMGRKLVRAPLLVDSECGSAVPVAVVVPKRNNLDGHGRPLGPVSHRIRQLEGLGYAVVLVQHFKFAAAAKSRRAMAMFLRQLIAEKVQSSSDHAE